ncbi:MAG: protein kinase [Acidobacteria bacterium]|nr:protein kinase [Acidobacteriota bacterium]MBI3421650.1 protein kinase [Acidobacteriota bacterium]
MRPKQVAPERWQRIEQLYHAALELPAGERAAWLEQACAGDAALRREVESLLRFDARAAQFIEAPALEIAARAAAETQDEPREDALVGQMLGHYRILSWLGAGGMSEVYLAFDTRLERQVALKLLAAQFTQDAEHLRRFTQEAKAASALNHPNIITIHEIGVLGDRHFIATEYVAGRTLRRLLTDAPPSLARALDVATQVAHALAVAHAAGIVHRDIKPENVMLRPDGYLKVLDFGIAKLKRAEAGEPARDNAGIEAVAPARPFATMPGTVLGTAQYMSPEQARGLAVDERTDIFSLGVMLYEMIAGRRPFEGATREAVMRAVTSHEPPPLAAETPAALRALIDRALQKERAARYQSAEELLADLQPLKQELRASGNLALPHQPAAWREAALTTSHARLDTHAQPAELSTAAESGTRPRGVRPLARAWRQRAWRLPLLLALGLALGLAAYFFARFHTQPALESLAVLPFVNAGAEAQADYLADGLTDGLINSLARLPHLKVIALSSVLRFKQQQSDPPAVARRLGVSAVLTGRIAQRGEALAISAELVDARDGSRLWGAHYERHLADLMLVQEELTQSISAGLRLRLSDAESKQLGKRYTENSEAYRLYLKGRYFFMQFTAEGSGKALGQFEQAIALDPNYAPAHAGIGYVYAVASGQYENPREAMRQARQAATRALALDDTLPEAHFALALVNWWADWDWPAAETGFRRALELAPNNATIRAVYGEFLSTQGRFPEATAHAQRALTLDPLSVYVSSALGKVYYNARQYDRALAAYRQTLELDPASTRAQRGLGRALTQQGRYAEAIAALRQAIAREAHPYFIADLGRAYALAGQRREAHERLAQLLQMAQRRYVPPVYLAKVYVALGEPAAALAWLDRALQEHSDQLTELRVDAAFDSLRGDARFAALLHCVGL